MNADRMRDFETLILVELKNLEQEDRIGAQGQAVVELDQQMVGRLSRMDALQSQAMAKAAQQRRDHRKLALRAALDRMGSDEFGYCQDCGEDIPEKRLELDPCAILCVQCARG